MLYAKLGTIEFPLNLFDKHIGATTWAKRSEAADVIFIYKLVDNTIESPEILEKVSCRKTVVNTRNSPLFHVPTLFILETII